MSLEKKEGWIWFNGEIVPWQDAKVHVLTHSLHYGSAVFEGVRSYATAKGPAIFRLADHTKRLLNSAKIIGLEAVPFSQAQLEHAQLEIVKKNQLQNAYIRPLIFSGAEALGLHAKNLSTQVMIAPWDWGAYLGNEKLTNGIKIKVSSFSRIGSNSAMSKAKACGNYMNSILAVREVATHGYDEALLLDKEGFVAEGSGENFFMIRDNVIITPDLSNILEGITRATVIQLAYERGYKVIERRITRDETYIADECFFTGTAVEIVPIISIDDKQIGSGKPGPITLSLQKLFFDVVYGRESRYEHWLSY